MQFVRRLLRNGQNKKLIHISDGNNKMCVYFYFKMNWLINYCHCNAFFSILEFSFNTNDMKKATFFKKFPNSDIPSKRLSILNNN